MELEIISQPPLIIRSWFFRAPPHFPLSFLTFIIIILLSFSCIVLLFPLYIFFYLYIRLTHYYYHSPSPSPSPLSSSSSSYLYIIRGLSRWLSSLFIQPLVVMGGSSMKVHPFARGLWDSHQSHEPQSTLSLGCKRFRPLAPKAATNNFVNNSSFDLKSFIKPESGPRMLVSSSEQKKDLASHQVESHPGGTRWNPTQEQIGILEMLYRGGMRTPNAQQIEQITEQLSKYGKIEGKNVFYWFQNHKARERQKQKRSILGLSHNPRTPSATSTATQVNTSITLSRDIRMEIEEQQISPYKRKFRSWPTYECSDKSPKKDYVDEEDKTLELFPLHPESR